MKYAVLLDQFGVTPAGVTPHLGLCAQALHGLVEDANQILHVELAESLAAHRHHVNLRLSGSPGSGHRCSPPRVQLPKGAPKPPLYMRHY
jgi:hypothetical protein